MKLLNPLKPTRWFYRYFISYIVLVAVILFAICAVVYGSFMQVFQKEIEQSNISVLKQTMDAVDTRISEMNRIAVQISSNSSLTPYKVFSNEYASYLTVSELQKYWAGNSFIYDIGLYYRVLNDEQRVHTPNGTYSLDDFMSRAYRYADWTKEQLLQQVEELRAPYVRGNDQVSIGSVQNSSFITYMYPLPMQSAKPYGVVMFLIQDKALMNIAKSIMDNISAQLYILGPSGQMLFSYSDGEQRKSDKPLIQSIDLTSLSLPVSEVRIDSQDYLVVKLKSDSSRWTYVTFMTKQQFLQKVVSIRNVFALTIVIIILLGIAMSIGLASRNYRPLRALMDLTGNQTRTDEMEWIGQYLRQGVEEKEGLVTKLRSKSGMVKQYLLLALLKGKTGPDDHFEEMAELVDLQLKESGYAVVIFHIDDFERFQTHNSPSMQDLFRFSICNVTEELFHEVGRGYAVDFIDDRGICLLLNVREGCGMEQIVYLASQTQQFFKQHYKFTMTVSISSIGSDFAAIHALYLEASRSSYYRFVKGKEQIIGYAEVTAEQHKKYLYPKELEERLVIALKQGKTEDVMAIIPSITEHITSGMNSPEQSNMAFLGIIHAIWNMMDEIQADVSESVYTQIELLLTQNMETATMLEQRLLQICSTLSIDIASQKESGNQALCDNVTEFVSARYKDPSLSLDLIAHHFGMSPSYLTRYFKNQTGTPLIRYVDMLRMDEAKRLLRSTTVTVKQIVEQTGYFDESNFIRKFKKLEGITPIQYRNLTRMKPEASLDPEVDV